MLEFMTKDVSFRKLVFNCGAFIWCIVVPLFGAPNKGTTILYCFRSPVLNPPVNGKIQELFKAFGCFSRQI